ncbi:ECSIT protein, partial [Nicator chloris]|nr:ECSIT protein [Nicator chloris]
PPDPERSFYFPLHLELDLERGPWDDEDFHVDEGEGRLVSGGVSGVGCAPLTPPHPPAVEEGPVFALCMAGAGDRRTLGRWISALQRDNPVLGRTAVVFRLAQGGHPDAEPPAGPP